MAKIFNSQSVRKAKPVQQQETFSLVSNEKLLAIYTTMIKCRMLKQRATVLFQQGKLASDLHASSGREVAAASIGIDLQPNDALSIAPGDWLPGFVKGLALENLFRTLASPSAQLDVKPVPASYGLEHKNILAVDEAHRPQSVHKHAVAAQAAKAGAVVAAILPSPDGALQPWHGVLAAAACERLPIVFVHFACTDPPAEAAPSRKGKNPDALFHGVPAISVDAFDAVAVYRVAYEAIVRARQGRGATMVKCLVHAGPTNPDSQKADGSDADFFGTDPVFFMENYLKRKGIESQQHRRQIVAAFNHDLELATRFLDQ